MSKKMKKYIWKISTIIICFSISSLVFAQTKTTDECLACHVELDDELLTPAQNYINDIHYKKNITCAGCHGGNPNSDDTEISMSEESGFIGIPDKATRYEVCVNCHANDETMNNYNSSLPTDQFDKLKISIHFQPSFDNTGPITDCITCHSVHNISKVDDPRSKVYPTKIVSLCGGCHTSADIIKNYNPALPIDQVAKYKTSVHGKLNISGDPNVAECASCHGSHDIFASNDPRSHVYATNIPEVCAKCHSNAELMKGYNLPTDQYDSYNKSVHGLALLEKGDISAPSCNDCHGNHGAVPPGVESISKVCGSCHVLNMELFEKSPHQKAFTENDFPECETCHGNHSIRYVTDDMIGTQESAVCIECHSSDDDNNGYFVAGKMKMLIDSLKNEDKATKEILEEATQKGMDISDSEYSLKDVRQILIQSRTTIHTFNLEKFKEKINEGFTIVGKARQAGTDAVDDYYFRRVGLGIATIIVTILVIGLYIKIRRLEKKT
ncbi:MAG: cytochrome c3 family protein [Ignavibacterium sp.]|nr:MAG: cytochrome c3 family protein [Ignavibacterium sp.]